MKHSLLIVGILLLALGAVVMVINSQNNVNRPMHDASAKTTPTQSATPRIPAYQTVDATKTLAATLNPTDFVGKTKEAYTAAKVIPATLAQLPCYCECDRGFGHKSLHSCFIDDHASHCAVCVDEALLAYKLQKEEGMSPEKIRETIIKKYGNPSDDGHAH